MLGGPWGGLGGGAAQMLSGACLSCPCWSLESLLHMVASGTHGHHLPSAHSQGLIPPGWMSSPSSKACARALGPFGPSLTTFCHLP